MFLLEFPQNLAGFLAFNYWNKLKKRPYKTYKDALVVHVPGRWGAITLGCYIFADDRYYSSPLIRHEYGHRIQSRKLLFLYLPLIGIPSLIWAGAFGRYRRKHQKDYFSFYTEAWANRLEESDQEKLG